MQNSSNFSPFTVLYIEILPNVHQCSLLGESFAWFWYVPFREIDIAVRYTYLPSLNGFIEHIEKCVIIYLHFILFILIGSLWKGCQIAESTPTSVIRPSSSPIDVLFWDECYLRWVRPASIAVIFWLFNVLFTYLFFA